jgi:hypothetical protein
MKRFLITALVVVMAIAFGACGNTEQVDTLTDTTEETSKDDEEDLTANPDLVVYDNFEEYYTSMKAACDTLDAAVMKMSGDWSGKNSIENAQAVIDAVQAVQNIGADIEYDINYGGVLSDTALHLYSLYFQTPAELIIKAGGSEKMNDEEVDLFFSLLETARLGSSEPDAAASSLDAAKSGIAVGWIMAEAKLTVEARSYGIEGA